MAFVSLFERGSVSKLLTVAFETKQNAHRIFTSSFAPHLDVVNVAYPTRFNTPSPGSRIAVNIRLTRSPRPGSFNRVGNAPRAVARISFSFGEMEA